MRGRGRGGCEHVPVDRRRRKLAVKEILRTNDAVLVSAVEALLAGAHIPYLVLDQNMSVLEGSLGILPRRVLVEEGCLKSARRLLEDAARAGYRIADLGAGVGAAGLALATRVPGTKVKLVEINAELVALAALNSVRN